MGLVGADSREGQCHEISSLQGVYLWLVLVASALAVSTVLLGKYASKLVYYQMSYATLSLLCV